ILPQQRGERQHPVLGGRLGGLLLVAALGDNVGTLRTLAYDDAGLLARLGNGEFLDRADGDAVRALATGPGDCRSSARERQDRLARCRGYRCRTWGRIPLGAHIGYN